MNKENENQAEDDSLTKKNNEQPELKKRINTEILTRTDMEKLIHEFEERQAELEIRIKELQLSKDKAETEVRKFSAFYEFAAMGYFTLKPDSTICELNQSGAGMLGRDYMSMAGRMFRSFVTGKTLPVFDDFLKKVFQSGSRQVCEVRLKIENDLTSFIHVEGLASKGNRICHIAAIDITDCKVAEETVYSLLSEKELLLKEVHHRVKNNMYNIGALLNMQGNAQDNPAARNVLFDAAGRVQSMSVLYDKLYRSEHTGAVSLKEYFPDLVYEIVAIFPQRKSVKIKTQIEDIILDARILSILGILVNEIITNSMKYAFTGRDGGVISVNVTKNDNSITVIIEDNGRGIPESVTFENSTGFGMQLVSMLTEQLCGSIRIERGNGTRFILEFAV